MQGSRLKQGDLEFFAHLADSGVRELLAPVRARLSRVFS